MATAKREIDLNGVREKIESIKDQLNIEDDQTALNVAILNQLEQINETLEDIEVHTNNTVRKL